MRLGIYSRLAKEGRYFMIQILKIIVLKIFSILPDSPFTDFFSSMDTDFLAYLNWFLPVDICADIMLTWLTCVVGVFLFFFARSVMNGIAGAVVKGISAGMVG